MVGEREKCIRYGMDDYISKPIDMDELKDIMSQWFNFDAVTTVVVSTPPLTLNTPLDLTQLRTFTEGDSEIEKELAAAFVKQSDLNLQTLQKNAEGKNEKTWSEAAHMMKGGAGGMGAFVLQALCDEAQHFSGSDEDRQILCLKIAQEYRRVKDYLKSIGLLS
jgi:two-component system sensor histidine kinase/response regulator